MIDFVNLLARIGTQDVKISVGPTKDVFESRRTFVHLLETVEIPTRCEVVVSGKVDGWIENEVGILETNPLERNERL